MRSIIGLKCPCLGCQTWEKVLDFRLLNLIATVIDFCTPPTEQGRGHPRSATVRVLATLRQFLREGTPWRSLKATADKVSGSTLRRHLEQWAGTGVLAQVHAVLVGMLRGDPTLILDTCSVRAKRGGDLTGPNPTDRGKQGTKYHIAGDGVPVACAATAANVNDTLVFERLFLAAFAVMARIQTVFADKGYDAEHHRDLCRKFDAEPCIHKRGQPHGSGLGKRRWPVERSNAWVLENKRLALRYDHLGFIIQSLLQAACIFLVAGRLAKEFCRGREGSYLPPPAQIPVCGFPAPGSCRRSDATGIRGLGGPSSSGPWAQAVGDMRIPALCPEHALALTLPSTGRLPSTLSAPDLSAGVVRGFTGTMQPSDFFCLPDRRRSFELPDPARDRQSGCGRQETSQVPTQSLTARTGLRLRRSDGPSQSGPAHVACGGSQRLGLYGKSLSRLNTVLVVSLCTLRDHRRR